MTCVDGNTVWITLITLGGYNGLSFEPRRIPLTTDRKIRIGRASKEIKKNRNWKYDNALFHCSVLTRNHACIELPNGPEGAIMLEDLGSRHGTFVNGIRLVAFKPRPIYNNDTIQLGTTIDLGEKVHKCLYVKITIILPEMDTIMSGKAPAPIHGSTYAVPEEYSDDEPSFDEDAVDDQTSIQNMTCDVVSMGNLFDPGYDQGEALDDEHDDSDISVVHSLTDELDEEVVDDELDEEDAADEEDVPHEEHTSQEDCLRESDGEDYEPDTVRDAMQQDQLYPLSNDSGRHIHESMNGMEQPMAPHSAPTSVSPPQYYLNSLRQMGSMSGTDTSVSATEIVNNHLAPLQAVRCLPTITDMLVDVEASHQKVVEHTQADDHLHQLNVEASANSGMLSIADMVHPDPVDPVAVSETSTKRKADVLDETNDKLNERKDEQIAAPAHVSTSNAAVVTQFSHQDKRPRTMLMNGLKATAYVVAGSVATFGFLLTPYADRLAQA